MTTLTRAFAETAPRVVRVIADNPAPMTLVAAGTIVVTKILANAMKPRGLAETLALMVVANAVCAGGAAWLTERGVLTWKVRDDHGCLVPLIDRRDDEIGLAAAD